MTAELAIQNLPAFPRPGLHPTDAMLADAQAELEHQSQFVDNIVAAARADGRDINASEMELVTRARKRQSELNAQIEPLAESARIRRESTARTESLYAMFGGKQKTPAVEYRSAGHFIADVWQGALGDEPARRRMDSYRTEQRAAAHQTTADNAGIIPQAVVGPLVNFVDFSRPMVAALGTAPLPGGPTFYYPRVTQHTLVGEQTAEKTELASRKLLIDRQSVQAHTFGGYLNVSRQDADWTVPDILDVVAQDMAGEYALQTEAFVGADLLAKATAGTGTALPATPTGANVAAALWGAVGQVYAATKGQGRNLVFVSPDMLGVVGLVFPPVNPQNAFSAGYSIDVSQGPQASIGGLSVIMSAALPAKTILVASSAAVRLFEQRGGQLQVTEPSVLGIQIAYYGYFAEIVVEAGGLIKVAVA